MSENLRGGIFWLTQSHCISGKCWSYSCGCCHKVCIRFQ